MKKAVLFLHGFSAKQEDNQIFINFMKNRNTIHFYTFTLPGHDTRRMKRVNYQDWIKASENEFKKILKKYNHVTIVGHSMGTILAIHLASHYSEVEKLVLISPAYIYGNIEQNSRDMKKWMKHEINPELGTGFEGAFDKLLHVPFLNFIEFKKLTKHNLEDVKQVKCPTLILHGTKDNIVPIHSSLYVYDNLVCQKDLTLIEDVRHQVFKSKKAKQVSKYIYDYMIGGIYFKIKKRDLL